MHPHLVDLLERYPRLEACAADVQAAFELLRRCYERDGVVYLCGNGGSAADAGHIVGELMKAFALPRRLPSDTARRLNDPYLARHLEGALRAVALTGHDSLATAFANDAAPDLVFAQQVFGYGRPGDVLWALSTSGNSANVLHALRVARAQSLGVLGLTGRDGGAVLSLCDVCIRVPETDTDRVQELHLPVYHTLCRMLEAHFFPPDAPAG